MRVYLDSAPLIYLVEGVSPYVEQLMQQLSSNEIVAETVPLTRAMMDQATAIRAQYGFKTPDAIHLACAITAKCDLFLTNDKQLQKQNEIAIKLVED